jgi:hypothetical protein
MPRQAPGVCRGRGSSFATQHTWVLQRARPQVLSVDLLISDAMDVAREAPGPGQPLRLLAIRGVTMVTWA